MAKKNAAALVDLPFYDYLRQFYIQNRRNVRSAYTKLSKKFLDFNDPSGNESGKFLRQPQFEALEMYVFLKEYCGNARLVDIFRDWQKRQGPFVDRGNFRTRSNELELFQNVDEKVFEAAFSRMQASAVDYPNYIYALTMGLGKTILMATCIFYEFLLAKKYPMDTKYCHNALVFAPDTTVLQSLKEIQTFDKSKVVPPEYVTWLDKNLKFHFLDDTSLSLQILEKSEYNIIISNNQKIILKRSHKEKTAVDSLFAAEKKYEPVKSAAQEIFAGLDDITDNIETKEDLLANQRFEMLKRLVNLGIYVDEAHHAFGKDLETVFTESGATSLRKTINELAACLKAAGTQVVACYNYTGTPYVNNVLLPEVVYTYSLKDAIDHRYLKQAEVKGYTNTKSKAFLKIVIGDFWTRYGERRVEGMLPKIAIYASDIAELTKEVRPAVESILADLGIPADRIIVNVGNDKVTTNDDLREFFKLDTCESEKQFILLVNKGIEGWNCRSLFAVALHRTPKSKVFVLQSTMRCLRAIGDDQETGSVYLSEENRQILNAELQENFRLNIDEFTGAGDKGKNQVKIRIVPPPVTVKVKRIRKHYELKELNFTGGVDFGFDKVDLGKYIIVETSQDLERIGRDNGSKRVIESEEGIYTRLSLTAEIARYLGRSCLEINNVLEKAKGGFDNVVEFVNKYSGLLYDVVIPTLFRKFYDLEEKTTVEDIELKLVKPPKGSGPDGSGPKGGGKKNKNGETENDSNVVATFYVKPDMCASVNDSFFAKYAKKSFHLDNYCFDSNPELDFFKTVLKDDEIEHLYFTGMLTSDKTEFVINYIDPESSALRSYYPDFLAQKKDGSYIIVEVKGENMIDTAVVNAKARSASALSVASGMEYLMVPGKKAAFGLHQPPKMKPLVEPRILRFGEFDKSLMYVDFLPVYSFAAACGKFGAEEVVDEYEPDGWIDVSELRLGRSPNRNMYIVRAVGESMNRRIQDGQFCVFEYRQGTCDDNDIALVQIARYSDVETQGAYTIKKYTSTRSNNDVWESARTETVTLVPVSDDPKYQPIALKNEGEYTRDYKVVGVLVKAIE